MGKQPLPMSVPLNDFVVYAHELAPALLVALEWSEHPRAECAVVGHDEDVNRRFAGLEEAQRQGSGTARTTLERVVEAVSSVRQ